MKFKQQMKSRYLHLMILLTNDTTNKWSGLVNNRKKIMQNKIKYKKYLYFTPTVLLVELIFIIKIFTTKL